MRNGIVIDKRDNVVVAIYQLTGGDEVTYTLPDGTEDTLTATQDIPLFHKIARTDIAAGERVDVEAEPGAADHLRREPLLGGRKILGVGELLERG